MAEQTSLVAQQVRLMHWAEQIRECQNRLEGMDVSTWCEQNNITKANYYYPLKGFGRCTWISFLRQKSLLSLNFRV